MVTEPMSRAPKSCIEYGKLFTLLSIALPLLFFISVAKSALNAITVKVLTDNGQFFLNHGTAQRNLMDSIAPVPHLTCTWAYHYVSILFCVILQDLYAVCLDLSGWPQALAIHHCDVFGTPHVAAFVAYSISTLGNKSPSDMSNYVKSQASQK